MFISPTAEIQRRFLMASTNSSLILNKMIGTGIFVSPSVVLAATGGKGISLILWAIGCIMTTAG
jgi:hypothetical protein